jgi:hypothetical protein
MASLVSLDDWTHLEVFQRVQRRNWYGTGTILTIFKGKLIPKLIFFNFLFFIFLLSSEPVAKRLIPALASQGGLNSAGCNSSRGSSRGGNLDRGGRGHRGVARGRGCNFRGAGQPAHHNRGHGK